MTAVYYEGPGRFTVGESKVLSPGAGEVQLDVAFCGVCGTDLHIARGAHGRTGSHPAGDRSRNVPGPSRSSATGVDGLRGR